MLFGGTHAPRISEQDDRDLQIRYDAPLLNTGPVYAFGLICLAATRVLLARVRNTNLYILLPVATTLPYLVFRVGGPFFMWQSGPSTR